MGRLRIVLAFVVVPGFACFEDQTAVGAEDEGSTSATTVQTETSATTGSASTEATSSDATSSDSTPTDSTPTDTDVGPDDCPQDHVCVGMLGGGWQGPVAIHEGAGDEPATMCPADWSQQGSAFRGLEVAPGSCECTCNDPAVATCAVQLVFFGEMVACVGTEYLDTVVGPDECVPLDSDDAFSVAAADTTTEVDCGEPSWEPLPDPTWQTRVDACAPELGPACTLGACVPVPPPPFDGRLCVFTNGDVSCPAASPFDTKLLVYADAQDDRTCECGCDATTASCGGTLMAYTDATCNTEAGADGLAGFACVTSPAPLRSAQLVDPVPEAACAPAGGGDVMGTVTEAGARTFCCTAL
jgi:hypothetical protein